jgi:hypothetical protein
MRSTPSAATRSHSAIHLADPERPPLRPSRQRLLSEGERAAAERASVRFVPRFSYRAVRWSLTVAAVL